MIGAEGVPTRLLESTAPSVPPPYLPARTQIVSPGLTAAGWCRAVTMSQGLPMLPSPPELPAGETYQFEPLPVGGGAAAEMLSVTLTLAGVVPEGPVMVRVSL